MNNNINTLVEKLYQNVHNDKFITIAYEITNELETISESVEAVESIIKLIEMNPDVDFGNPGPLVHFVEKFNEIDYDYKLIESIKRHPTLHTLFMFNRLVNSLQANKRDKYVGIFDYIICLADLDENVRKLAKEFRSFQLNENFAEDRDTCNTDNLLKLKNIVLVGCVNNQKDLLKIKNVLGLGVSIKDLLHGSKNPPYVLIESIPFGMAQGMIERIGELKAVVEITDT